MGASPLCTINGQALEDGALVNYGATVSIALSSTTDVYTWDVSCVATDTAHDVDTINAGLSLVGSAFQFVAPPDTSALLFRSRVNNGLDSTGAVKSEYFLTFSVYTPGQAQVDPVEFSRACKVRDTLPIASPSAGYDEFVNNRPGLVSAIGFNFSFESATWTSSTVIPFNSWVVRSQVAVSEAFSAGATLTIEVTDGGHPQTIQETTDTVLQLVANHFQHEHIHLTYPGNVKLTIGGSPTTGLANVLILYVRPES